MIAGRIIDLWRYPVKSLLGERLTRAWVGPDGVEGDRVFALRSVETGRVLSAKKFSRLLEAHSRTEGRIVTIVLPSGDELDAVDPAAAQKIGDWLGLPLEIARAPGGTERPMIQGDERVFRGRAGGFFDSSAVHIVTTSTLEQLTEYHPAGRWDARRFRPNVVLETLDRGFVEEEWIGRTLRLGSAEVEITKACSRCVITTHEQEDLPLDRDVLRTVIARNDEHVGVYGIVRQSGTVSVGDEALLA